ncbi:MAG: efflux RND transporter periplasmic adaptor subunit [Burkholderiales bacterium]|nr:efflux RND transporter periplasmic adaptor subunit [Burkholderiales bacterium]
MAAQSEADQRLKAATENHVQAVRELDRVSRLVKDGFMSPQAAEQARNAEINAASEVEAARFRARAAAADVRVARSGLGVSRAPGGLVDVRSPLMGQILRIPDASERIVAAGTPLMTLGDLHHLEVVVELLSTEAVKVAPGMPVLIEGWGGDRPLRAKVRRVEPYAVTKVSALGIEEKRVKLLADFVDAPDHLGDGYRVTARVVIWQSPNVLKVPASALFRCEKNWCVFAVEGGRAHVRRVDIGQRNVNEAEVRSGLSDGQIVIRYPSNDLADGARVRGR